MHQRLELVDPVSAAKLHPNDLRRIVRALEVHHTTGQPISHQQLQFDEALSADECRVYVLDWPRPSLHSRINDRVTRMFEAGFVEEVRSILERFGELGPTAKQAVGYREVQQHLQNEFTLERAIEATRTRTRQFAKRQYTWFRSLHECQWVARDDQEEPSGVATRILEMDRNAPVSDG